ncbi:hypothetical protein [Adhaeribacter rhizoryzae]|uniref:Uncharacterized protein n=1 Tax=Adhaeribacter rhizoryzae TaxID=2607907 RepID=A0A5M6DLN5_9BACT|nr:hypothetical protein [Adhaeribacter rhizoryzae]KAA5548448.1 hypothetical protein F0145_06905 [Adhaeribacter rhizoryzae]
MEKIISKYQQLFKVNIYHHYFLDENNLIYDGTNDLPPARKAHKLQLYQVPDWLQIEPEVNTRGTMYACNLIFKPTKTGFIIVTKTNGPDQPSATLDNIILTFYLRWRNAGLAANTALPLLPPTNSTPTFYTWGNEFARNNIGLYPNLSRPVPTYQNTRAYVTGEIVKSGAQQFVALNRTSGNAPNVPAFWRETDGNLNYTTSTSLQPRPAAIPAGVIGKIEITGRAGLGNYSVLTGANKIKAAQVYQLHLDKF